MVGGCSGKSRLKMGQTDEGEVVEAVGYAPYEPKNLIATKRASLTDAQRNAVEKAVGVYISAKAMVEQAIQIENNILAKTEGYVRKFDIVKEEVEGDLYKTTIRALVALKDLEADLKDMSLLNTPELERPRVRVVISEMIDKSSTDELPASRALESVLIEAGYKVVGEDRINDAELIIQGKASAHPFQSQGLGGFISYRARMTVQVVQPGTNDVIFSLSKEASGLGGSEELAALKSLETVGNLLGVELAERVETAWVKSRNLMVFVEGVETFEQVDRIKKTYPSTAGCGRFDFAHV